MFWLYIYRYTHIYIHIITIIVVLFILAQYIDRCMYIYIYVYIFVYTLFMYVIFSYYHKTIYDCQYQQQADLRFWCRNQLNEHDACEQIVRQDWFNRFVYPPSLIWRAALAEQRWRFAVCWGSRDAAFAATDWMDYELRWGSEWMLWIYIYTYPYIYIYIDIITVIAFYLFGPNT